MAEQYANFGTATLITGIGGTSTATTWTVLGSAGYPTSANFHVTIDNEILLCTASSITSGTFTMSGSRGQENTAITTHSAGAIVLHAITAGAMDQIIADGFTLTSFAGKPAASKAGRLQTYTDVPNAARDNGTTLVPFGPLYQFTDPTTVSFAWRNQGSATESVNGQSLYLLAPALAGDNIKGREIAQPSRPYTITICIVPHMAYANFNAGGLYFTDNATGKIVNFVFNATRTLQVNYYTNATTFSSTPISAQEMLITTPLWMRVTDDGTNFLFYWSSNGVNFHKFGASLGRTAFLAAPSHVGYFAMSANGTWPAGVNLYSWQQT